jgi:hypothetical protein
MERGGGHDGDNKRRSWVSERYDFVGNILKINTMEFIQLLR